MNIKKLLLHLLVAVALVTAIGIGAFYYLIAYTNQDQVVETPDIVGLDLVEAEGLLRPNSLEGIVVDSLYLPKMKGGEIVDQIPVAGSSVKRGRKIFLTVARYKSPMVKLPNVEEQTLPLAIAKLNSYGFEVGDLIYQPSECTDCIISAEINGKKIPAGTAINKGKKINLIVGAGATGERITIPKLFGLTVAEAEKILNLEGLNIGATPYVDCTTKEDSNAARIYEQIPAPNPAMRIQRGSSIDLFLSPDLSLIPNVNVDSIKSRLSE